MNRSFEIVKVSNGYMVLPTKNNPAYYTPVSDAYVFNTLDQVLAHLKVVFEEVGSVGQTQSIYTSRS